MPPLSALTILNRSNIKEFGTFQEMVVDLGMDEVSIAFLICVNENFKFLLCIVL
jgi:hypothetical protein